MIVAYTGRPELDCRSMLRADFVPPGSVCDFGVSIGGSHIFTPAEIARARCGIVNLHFAPLPQYRGRYCASWAIANREPYFGATLHYVDPGIDTGPIIAERLFPIEPTLERLRARAFGVGLALFEAWAPRLMAAAERGERVPAWTQDETKAHRYRAMP